MHGGVTVGDGGGMAVVRGMLHQKQQVLRVG
jgi:hypothetical protein